MAVAGAPYVHRRLAVGAEVQTEAGSHFRVWAPRRQKVEVVFPAIAQQAELPSVLLDREPDGYFSGFSSEASDGTRYAFRLDDSERLYPDPASRRQPDGPHAPSQIVDPTRFQWTDREWRGVELKGQVIYELHIGTFTREGTWRAAAKLLPHLVDLGVTLVEVMPVCEFAGDFGWGYDGVDMFAPTRLYGTPDDFRRFVDTAHRGGLGVMLDVVYNHFGPVGNYISEFSQDYFSKRHHTDWGDGLNFDGQNAGPVREFIISNAGYWIDEFHLDGLRLDAIHAIVDDSADHVLAALTRRVRQAAQGRRTLVTAENELQKCWVIRGADAGGYGMDAAWNDDFHHTCRVAASGHNEYYFGDYQGTPQEMIAAVRWGYLYQGQWNLRQERKRGSPCLDTPAMQFVTFLQNHDQVGNSPRGKRIHELTSPGRHRALTALWALAPGTPLLFQGQEFSSSAPFLYFADHEAELSRLVRQGREGELRNFSRLAGADAADYFDDPCDVRTFEKCKLDFSEVETHSAAYLLHRDLLRLRREDPVFSAQRADRIEGATIAPEAFLLRYFGEHGNDRLLLVNLGRDFAWQPVANPLVAAPADHDWKLLWSSEDPRYGGLGTRLLDTQNWYLPGHATIVLRADPLA